MQPEPRYWFRAKRYGWGWGLPLTWQGWAVLGAFMLLLSAGSALLSCAHHPLLCALLAVLLSTALVGICYARGEPPKWRWG